MTILAVVACASFFVKGAQMEGRSPLVWGGLSLGLWLTFTSYIIAGLIGGLLSQVVLFIGLAMLPLRRNGLSTTKETDTTGRSSG